MCEVPVGVITTGAQELCIKNQKVLNERCRDVKICTKSHNKLTLKLTNLYSDRANLTLKLFASPNHVCEGAVPAGGDNNDSMNTV